MTAVEMAAFIRYLVITEAQATASKSWWGGKKSVLEKKKVVLANDMFSEEPGTCWWILTNKAASPNELIIKKVGKTIFSVAKGVASASIGGHVVQSVGASIKSSVGKTASGVKSMSGAVAGADALFTQMVRACVVGTKAEFAVELEHCYGGGAAAFTKILNGEIIISLKTYGKTVISVMESIERNETNETRKIETTREYCRGGSHYKITMGHELVKLTEEQMVYETRARPAPSPPPGPDLGGQLHSL